MEDGNGKDKPIEQPESKTEEVLAQERLKRYQDNPQSFTEEHEIVVCVKRNPKGLMYMIDGKLPQELNIAWAELNRKIINILNSIEIYRAQEEKSKIIPAKHGILDFGRRHK